MEAGGAKFHQQRHLPLIADRPHDGENRMISHRTNYGRLRRNAQSEITYSSGLCVLRIFYILKCANLPLMFKLREICSVDSEENLPPDVRF